MKQVEQFLYTFPKLNKDVEFPNENEFADISLQAALLCFKLKWTKISSV